MSAAPGPLSAGPARRSGCRRPPPPGWSRPLAAQPRLDDQGDPRLGDPGARRPALPRRRRPVLRRRRPRPRARRGRRPVRPGGGRRRTPRRGRTLAPGPHCPGPDGRPPVCTTVSRASPTPSTCSDTGNGPSTWSTVSSANAGSICPRTSRAAWPASAWRPGDWPPRPASRNCASGPPRPPTSSYVASPNRRRPRPGDGPG